MAADARKNNEFFTRTLGLRRVKKTVNFDSPEVYHLYYGDTVGSPGSVMTYFPHPNMNRGQKGVGEVGVTEFAIPEGAIGYWRDRLSNLGVQGIRRSDYLDEKRLEFEGPDGDGFALVEAGRNGRKAWTGAGIGEAEGILGFHGARFRLRETAATGELLTFMGYQKDETADGVTRYRIDNGNEARTIDLEEMPDAPHADQGAGSVHHIAFAVEDRAAQQEVRKALLDTGYEVTPAINRDYFWAIYFQTPGGILFEIATNEPGFDRDESLVNLGKSLKLPERYEPYRKDIEAKLPELV